MKKVTARMIKIYNIKDMCFMGYKVSKSNPYTYHHITKKEDGGNSHVKNGAILTLNAHDYLNTIEFKDYEIYCHLNNLFLAINEQGYAPTLNQYKAINAMLKMFEENHKDEKYKSGKPVIKSIFTKREIYDLN